MVAGSEVIAYHGPYLMVTWDNGVQVEAAGLIPADCESLSTLVGTANEQAALHYEEDAA